MSPLMETQAVGLFPIFVHISEKVLEYYQIFSNVSSLQIFTSPNNIV